VAVLTNRDEVTVEPVIEAVVVHEVNK
jgi:hypothetical protein